MENKIYKLKKEYPGSPKEGTIVIEDEKGYYNEALGIKFTRKSFVENYPNSWELQIKNLDYEILSFQNPDNKLIYSLNGIKYYNETSNKTLKYCLDFYKINSVKRLSDGKIFTVGNKLNFNKIGIGKLLEIQFEVAPVDKGTKKLCFVNDNKFLGKWWEISELTKMPLFTTEDGIDIFENQKFYYIGDAFNICKTTCLFKGDDNFYRSKIFSTKEKAEEYVKMNTPEFSRVQIIKFLNRFYPNHGETAFYEYFINQNLK